MQPKQNLKKIEKASSSSSSDGYKDTNPFKNKVIAKDDPFYESDFKPKTTSKVPLKPLKKTKKMPLNYFTLEEDWKLVQAIKKRGEGVSVNATCLQFAKDNGRSHDSVRTRFKKFLNNLSESDCRQLKKHAKDLHERSMSGKYKRINGQNTFLGLVQATDLCYGKEPEQAKEKEALLQKKALDIGKKRQEKRKGYSIQDLKRMKFDDKTIQKGSLN